MNPIPYAIYARQSHDKKVGREGEGLAIDRQVADCLELAETLGLKGAPVIYADNDVSASTGKRRPEYERLLAALRDSRHRVLLVWHTDRLHRRPIELEQFIEVAESARVTIHTVKAGELDLATPSGRMVARMLGAAARQEVEHKAERQMAAIKQGAMAGRRHGGGRSFGYGETVIENGVRRFTDIHSLNKVEAAAISAAFKAILRGDTTTSIWKAWNARGLLTQFGNKWDGTTFRNMVKRPSLAGLVVYKGEVQEGVKAGWPTIVPRAKWEAVQSIITAPGRNTSPGPTPKHLCGGVTFCVCGTAMRSAVNSIKSKRTGISQNYSVYKCKSDAAGHSTILAPILDTAVRDGVIDELWRRKDAPARRSDEDDAALVVLHAELEKVRRAEARLAEGIAFELVSESAARATSAKIAADVARLTGDIDKITRDLHAAGVDDAAWEKIWQRAAGRPVFVRIRGERHFDAAAAVIASMEKRGMSREEAVAKIEIGRRFDAVGLEQQRALVRSLVKVTVDRGRGTDRVAVKPI